MWIWNEMWWFTFYLPRGISGDVLRYTWKKDDEVLDLSLPKYQTLSGQGGSFIIKNPSDEDEGFYQCFATNRYGTAMTVKSMLKKAGRWRYRQYFPSLFARITDSLIPVRRPCQKYHGWTHHIFRVWFNHYGQPWLTMVQPWYFLVGEIRDRPKPVFLVSAVAESGAVNEVQLWP